MTLNYDKGTWEEIWKNNSIGQLNKQEGIDGNFYDGWKWILGKEIRIYKEPQIRNYVVESVIEGTNAMINEIGIDMKLNYYGSHPTMLKEINNSTLKSNVLDGDNVFKRFVAEAWRKPEMEGKPHADLIIIDKYLTLGKENWGQSDFNVGGTIISVPGERQENTGFIRNVTKHEVGHLLGYVYHHDTFHVTGYAEPGNCVMYWEASTDYLCPRCKDALTFHWESLQRKTGIKFFK